MERVQKNTEVIESNDKEAGLAINISKIKSQDQRKTIGLCKISLAVLF